MPDTTEDPRFNVPVSAVREPHVNISPSRQRNGSALIPEPFADRGGGIGPRSRGEEFQTIHITGMRNSPSMNKLGTLFTSINKSVSSAFVNLVTAPSTVGVELEPGHSQYETLPSERLRKKQYYTGLNVKGAPRGGGVGGRNGPGRDEQGFRGDARELNCAGSNLGGNAPRYSGENVGINRGYHDDRDQSSTMQRPMSSDMGMYPIGSSRPKPHPHGRTTVSRQNSPAAALNGNPDRPGSDRRVYNRYHTGPGKRDSEMMPSHGVSHPACLDANATDRQQLGRDPGGYSTRRTPIMIPRVSTGHSPYNSAGDDAYSGGGWTDRVHPAVPQEHNSTVLRQRGSTI